MVEQGGDVACGWQDGGNGDEEGRRDGKMKEEEQGCCVALRCIKSL